MFGISLSKLLLLGLVIAAVWYGWKWFERRGRAAVDDKSGEAENARDHDLTACPDCGTYVAKPVTSCPEDHTNCPMKTG